MSWSVSRVRTKPTPGGGLEVDLAVTSPSGESSTLTVSLSSRAADELRTLLRELLPRG
jgi:hypothetical protein